MGLDCSTTNTACLYCRRQGQRREAIKNSLEEEETPKRDGTDGPKPTFLVIAWMIETPILATKPEYRYLLRGGYRGSSGTTIFFMFFSVRCSSASSFAQKLLSDLEEQSGIITYYIHMLSEMLRM